MSRVLTAFQALPLSDQSALVLFAILAVVFCACLFLEMRGQDERWRDRQ